MSNDVTVKVNEAQLAKLMHGLGKLQTQLPTHQVAALQRTGDYLADKMRGHAEPMNLDRKVYKSIGWKETHGVVRGMVTGKSSSIVIGPGARGQMPIHAPLMETGWSGGWWPNMTRLAAWAGRRIPNIQPRQVFYIARAMARRGALSRTNPRAHGEEGYHYVQKTWETDGNAALQKVLDGGFGEVKSTLDEI